MTENLEGEEFERSLYRDKVLIVGSGRSASEIENWNLDGWSLVTINHAYQIRDDWEFAGYAGDFPKDIQPRKKLPNQHTFSHKVGPAGRVEIVPKSEGRGYERAMAKFDRKHNTMFFNVSYWVLVYLRPSVIGYMGCDMNYEADKGEPTHFYGVGKDILKRGIPDPDRYIKQHHKGNKEVLYNLFTELQRDAANQDCRLINFSKEESRLPYDKEIWNKFK